MTVLEDGGDLSAPPCKRVCLSNSRPTQPFSDTYPMATPLDAGVMLNGYGGLVDTHKNHSPDDSSANSEGVSPVATLCNLGNTCFLNSVLYTLRFAPAFLHNLHHLAVDLVEYSGRYSHLKSKSSSLGRGIGGGSKSWSNKDLSSMGQSTAQEDKIALATLRLHELYEGLHNAELKDHMEPYQPEIFLTALREVNSIFEGNQQHDAHELLVCLLDNIRETCRQLSQLSERQRCIIPPPPPPTCPLPPAKSSFSSNVRKSLKLGKAKSNGVLDKKHGLSVSEDETQPGLPYLKEPQLEPLYPNESQPGSSYMTEPQLEILNSNEPQPGCSYMTEPQLETLNSNEPQPGCSYMKEPQLETLNSNEPQPGCSYMTEPQLETLNSNEPQPGCSYMTEPQLETLNSNEPQPGCSYMTEPQLETFNSNEPQPGCSYMKQPQLGSSRSILSTSRNYKSRPKGKKRKHVKFGRVRYVRSSRTDIWRSFLHCCKVSEHETQPEPPYLKEPQPGSSRSILSPRRPISLLKYKKKKPIKSGKVQFRRSIWGPADGPLFNGDSNLILNEEEGPRVGHNFISEDFQGVTLLRTTCLECEQVTERKETFCDICVPITSPSGNCDENVSLLYHSAIVTEEFLQDTNKYWCEPCSRYNEARRCVRYESLPRLLILQLKRFSSSSYGSVVSKVNEYMPTPLILSCFCIKCKDVEENKRVHRGYQLYGVIMHLGATMASGHYVTYVCGRDTVIDCATCTRDKRKTASLSGGAGKPSTNHVSEKHSTGIFRFFKSSKPSYPNTLDSRGQYFPPCRSADCCGVKLDSHEPVWLECDDETVRTLTRKQLEDILAPKNSKNSALTPYLLFYSRIQ